MKISVVCLVLNLIFALWLIGPYREAGLGIANTLSAAFNVWLLAHALRRKLPRLEWAGLRRTLLTLLATAAVAGEVALLLNLFWEQKFGHAALPQKLGAVFVPMALAGLLYLGLGLWLKVSAAREISSLVVRRLRRGR
jgi:peptidoglycan biosynthesis protein MviN/MurJ (putative lipid II flippase)